MAETAAGLGERELIQTLRATLERCSTARASASGSLDHARGILALAEDDSDEAEQHFRAGLEWSERERCPVEAARCEQGLAEIAATRGQLDEARSLLQQAVEAFKTYGGGLYLRQAEADLAELAERQSATRATYPDGLSPAEVDVLRLIQAGMTNRQIADQLTITHNTATAARD